MRGGRSGLIVEYRCEGLKPAADVSESFAVAGEVLRLLPCLLREVSLVIHSLSKWSRIPRLGCIVAGSVPDAAVGCLVRPASSGRSRRGASPTVLCQQLSQHR